jgi:hypothetical protein
LVFVSFVSNAANHILGKKISLVSLREEILQAGIRLLDEPLLEGSESKHGHGAVVHNHSVHTSVRTGVGQLVLHVAREHHVSSFKEFVVVGEVEDV